MKNFQFLKSSWKSLWNILCIGLSFTRFVATLLYTVVHIKRKILFANDNSLLEETARFMTAIRACILLSANDNLSPMFVPALRFRCFLRVRSFTLIPDISARIDYASSSLSDVLVSIGDRCGRNAHVPVFSTRIARFPMPV